MYGKSLLAVTLTASLGLPMSRADDAIKVEHENDSTAREIWKVKVVKVKPEKGKPAGHVTFSIQNASGETINVVVEERNGKKNKLFETGDLKNQEVLSRSLPSTQIKGELMIGRWAPGILGFMGDGGGHIFIKGLEDVEDDHVELRITVRKG